MSDLRAELNRHCPDLTRVDFGSYDSDPKVIADLLVETLVPIEYCRYSYTLLDRNSCIGILKHHETLTQVWFFVPIAFACPTEPDLNLDAKFAVSLILQICRSLEEFIASNHKMDISDAEEPEWACEGLKLLKVQFQGLETVPAVDDCLERLVDLRNRYTLGDIGEIYSRDSSISHRVCKKLFPMKKLKTVWMGTRDYYLATF